MLVGLMIIALIFVEFRFIITPGIDRWDEMRQKQNTVSDEVERVKLNIATLSSLQEKLSKNLDEINSASKPYFDEIQPDIMLNFMREIFLRNGLTLTVYVPTEILVSIIDVPDVALAEKLYQIKTLAEQYNSDVMEAEPADPDATPEPEPTVPPTPYDDIEFFSVAVTSVGTYEQLRTLFMDVAAQNRAIRINSLSIAPGEVPEMLNIGLTLEFYGVTKLDEDKYDPLSTWPRDSYDGGTDSPYPIVTPTPVPGTPNETTTTEAIEETTEQTTTEG